MADSNEIEPGASAEGVRRRRTAGVNPETSGQAAQPQPQNVTAQTTQGSLLGRFARRLVEPITLTKEALFTPQRSWIERELTANNPGDDVAIQAGLEDYDREIAGIDDALQADIYSKDAFEPKMLKPDEITEPVLTEYFNQFTANYSAFTQKSLEYDYKQDPQKWFDSKPTRARLVLIEATKDNIPALAKAMLNSSPLERIAAVGLDENKRAELKTELLKSWEEKITNSDNPGEYREKIETSLGRIEEGAKLNSEASIETLMGPHGFTTTSDISYENIQKELESTFSSKIDEVILFGDTDKLVGDLPLLADKCEAIKYAGIKAGEFDGNQSAMWIAQLQGVEDPIKHVTSSKNPDELLKEGNFVANPRFEEILNTALAANGLSDNKEAQDFFKSMAYGKIMYNVNLSPNLYATTTTKAQSGLNGKGAIVVARAIFYGLVGVQKAIAEAMRFTINATMFDTSNDMHQEKQEFMEAYEKNFTKAYNALRKSGKTDEQAIEVALTEVARNYAAVENKPEIVSVENRAATLRNVSLAKANQTNKYVELAIKVINPQVIAFAAGMAGTVAGIYGMSTGWAAPVAVPAVGTAIGLTAFGGLGGALTLQWAANEKALAPWHRLSARARQQRKVAMDSRQQLVVDRVEAMVQGLEQGLNMEQIHDKIKAKEENAALEQEGSVALDIEEPRVVHLNEQGIDEAAVVLEMSDSREAEDNSSSQRRTASLANLAVPPTAPDNVLGESKSDSKITVQEKVPKRTPSM